MAQVSMRCNKTAWSAPVPVYCTWNAQWELKEDVWSRVQSIHPGHGFLYLINATTSRVQRRISNKALTTKKNAERQLQESTILDTICLIFNLCF